MVKIRTNSSPFVIEGHLPPHAPRALVMEALRASSGSPLETAVGTALVILLVERGEKLVIGNYRFAGDWSRRTRDHLLVDWTPGPLWRLMPQANIGKSRADFLLTYTESEERRAESSMIIECDGHDYHSERADLQRDKGRDRARQDEGYLAYRFTGSEVYADAFTVAESCITSLVGAWRRGHTRPT